jgi:hypothetical protein
MPVSRRSSSAVVSAVPNPADVEYACYLAAYAAVRGEHAPPEPPPIPSGTGFSTVVRCRAAAAIGVQDAIEKVNARPATRIRPLVDALVTPV